MSRTTIVTPVYLGQPHRVGYFNQYVKSCLGQRDFDKIDFVFLVEPEFVDLDPIIALRKYPNVRVLINQFKYGLLLNQYVAMYYSFERLRLEHAIYIEDDCIFSNDINDITQFYINSSYYDNKTIFTYLNKDNLIEPPTNDDGKEILEIKNNYGSATFSEMTYFAALGYLCTAKMWRECVSKWNHQSCVENTIMDYIKNDFKTVTPKLSRLNHIGVEGAFYNQSLYDAHNFAKYTPQNFNDALNYRFVIH